MQSTETQPLECKPTNCNSSTVTIGTLHRAARFQREVEKILLSRRDRWSENITCGQPAVEPSTAAAACVHCRYDRIVDLHYPILSCFWKMISVSDSNPVLIEIILSVSENYPKVYCVAQHSFLCCVYFASWGKITAGAISPLAKHDWLK